MFSSIINKIKEVFRKMIGFKTIEDTLNINAVLSTKMIDAIELWTDMYKEFAETARSEGFTRIAFLFEEVAKIEKEHEARYLKLLENVENGLVFSKDGEKIWKCRNCGHIVVGTKAPEVCPVCRHPQAYFEIKAENY